MECISWWQGSSASSGANGNVFNELCGVKFSKGIPVSVALIGLIKEYVLLIYLRQRTPAPFNCQHICNPPESGIVGRVPNILDFVLSERVRSVVVISNKANAAI